jgi:translation initiation factor IF-2
MSEVTTPRLMAAAKEFNIGKDTLVDFLAGKGFSKDDLKPTSKLTEEMYRSLQQEFQSDKVAKIKSDQIDLPRGGTVDSKRKRDEEEIVFKKEIRKPIKEEEKPAPVVVEQPKPVIPVVAVPVTPEPPPPPPPPPVTVQVPVPEEKELTRVSLKAQKWLPGLT